MLGFDDGETVEFLSSSTNSCASSGDDAFSTMSSALGFKVVFTKASGVGRFVFAISGLWVGRFVLITRGC